MAITDYHRAIFTYLEAYRHAHPDANLTYSLRQKNKAGRPRNLYLFTGSDNYIDIGLYQPISNINKTRSIILGIGYNPATDTIKSCELAIMYNDPHLMAQRDIYDQIIDQIGRDQFREVREHRFELRYPSPDWQENLRTYLEQHKPIIDKVIQQAGATATFNIPQEKLEADILVANQPIEPEAKAIGKFTWIPFYRELCAKLLHYSTDELISLTKEILTAEKLPGLIDQDADGNQMDLTVIDPYTVLSFIRICSDDKRATLFQHLKKRLVLTSPAPTDWAGLYTDKNQWIWLFGYAHERGPDDIDKLWQLYKQVEQNEVSEDLFNQVIAIKKLSKSKLTESLFSQYPATYFPLNSKTKEWLKKRKLPYQFASFADYMNLMDAIEQHDSRPFYELSEEAYLENQQANTKYYCVGVKFGQESQLNRFIQEGIWENGYGDGNEKYKTIVKGIPVGAKLAAKATYTQGPKHSISVLEIKAIGEVVANKGDGRFLEVVWSKGFESFKLEGKGSYQDTIQEVNQPEDIQLIFFHQANEPIEIMSTPDNKYPQNIILYGPPGTGKTFGTIDLAVDIIDGQRNPAHKANKVRFDQLRKEGQIEFVTFHQSYTYEDFVVGIKPDVNAGSLKFDYNYGVLYRLAEKARTNFLQNEPASPFAQKRPFEEVFEQFIEPLTEEGKEIPVKMAKSKWFNLTNVSERAIEFRKSNGNTDDVLSIAVLKRMYEGSQRLKHEGLNVYYNPLAEVLQSLGETEGAVATDVPLKNYVLIIDEINRANMSRVFGELITLLEDDKRLGADNELTVTLPSGEPFVLPPNLYLIGTMNTADKSLALLDIALRRRFEFIYTKPNPDLLDSPARDMLTKLNKAIRDEHKPADFLIGHAYFIGKEASQLPGVFNNRVIPLLMEYFNGKVQTVVKVLEKAGVTAKADEITDELTVSHVE